MNKEQKSFWEYGAAWATTVVIHTYTTACFFSSEIYGTEEAYKKASEAKEELSSWQYERR